MLCYGKQLLGHETQLIIPFFAEAADERLFQKLIDADVLLLSFAHSCLADIPTVIVDAYESIAESLFADGVELAGDRLAPPNLALAVGAVKGTQTAMRYSGLPVLKVKIAIAGKHTVFATHDAGHQIAVVVGIGDTLLVDDALCRRAEVTPHHVECVFHLADLIEGYRCARVAFYTALSFAGVQITTKFLRENIRGNEHVSHFYDMQFHVFFFLPVDGLLSMSRKILVAT